MLFRSWEFTSHLHSNYDYYFKAEEEAKAMQEVQKPQEKTEP